MKLQEHYDVGIYCRLSRDDNNGSLESMSIANQRQVLVDYVNEKGWTLRECYIDEHAIIGTSGENLVKSRVSALVPFNFFVRASTISFKSQNIIMEGCANHVKNNRSMQ